MFLKGACTAVGAFTCHLILRTEDLCIMLKIKYFIWYLSQCCCKSHYPYLTIENTIYCYESPWSFKNNCVIIFFFSVSDLRKVTRRVGEGMNSKLNPAHSLKTLNCSLILSHWLYGTAGYVLAALAVHFLNHSPLVQVLFGFF